MVQTVLRTFQVPQLLMDKVVCAPIMQVVQVPGRHHLFRGAKAYPQDQAVQRNMEIPQFVFDKEDRCPLCRSCAFHRCKT